MAMQVMWCSDLVIAKLSILTLYSQLFKLRLLRLILQVTAGVIVAWYEQLLIFRT